MQPEEQLFGRFAETIKVADKAHPCRLGFFGGTFDPPHLGHLLLAQSALEQCQLDGVLFVPTGRPVRKLLRGFTPAEKRLAMLELALSDDPNMAISRVETDRVGANFTIDSIKTLLAAANELSAEPDALELFLILGADSFLDLPTWRSSQVIAELVTVLYAARPTSDESLLAETVREGCFKAQQLEMPAAAISSSDLRARARQGSTLRYYCPDSVVDYIAEQELYWDHESPTPAFAQVTPPIHPVDFQDLTKTVHQELESRLSPYRFQHSLGVAETAAKLAQTYGFPVDKAYLTGLLHDWDKDLSTEELYQKASAAGLPEAGYAPEMKDLLHAATGAVSVAERFPELPSDVFQAIARHTVPCENMSQLDMIVHIADLLEPSRHPEDIDLEPLRQNIGICTLEELFVEVFASELKYLIDQRKQIAPGTFVAWNHYLNRQVP